MKPNRTALITGASSGLGNVFAQRFAQSGYDLIITGRRQDKLNQIAEELIRKYDISVQVVLAELSAEEDIEKLVEMIESQDHIHVLVNNAGYGSGMEFCKCDLTSHLQMLQVHVVATLRLVYAIMPQMITRREGTIINVSSLGAFMPAPGSTMYSATKLFLKSFTESLHMEVSRYGIKLHCLCPGFTHTDFHSRRATGNLHKNSGMIPWMEAETVVDDCLQAVQDGKVVYVPGVINRLLIRIVSMMPGSLYYKFMMKIALKSRKTDQVQSLKSFEVQPAS
jgi:uncharacterized protein